MFRPFGRYFSSGTIKMVRILNVAEKNDAAKSVSELLSRGRYRKRDGFSRFNKIYEFEYNILNQQNVTMTMTSVSGHLLNYEFTGLYRKWYSCNPVALFDAPVEKVCLQDYQDIKRTLEREVRGCQSLIIWTDCDREGENIGFEIIRVCQAVKPNLRVYRAKFSEITPAAIQRACANLIQADKNVSDAVDVRQELDLRIGAAFTRFQTMRLQKVFPTVLADQLVSYGSCQFPTLGFVVERYKQVQAFIPEPFWKISVEHKADDGTVTFAWKRGRLFNHLACLVLYQHCIENPLARVVDVKSRPKSKWRPQALETVELEKLASRKLRINAKETMRVAEKLYTQGYISYPRTETNIFPKELDLRPLVEAQTQDVQWGEFARGVLERGPTPRNGNKTDNAHPPIHPLKYTNNLQGNEATVYEFVVRHFLACCSQDAQGQETTVDIEIAEEKFSASGLMIIARNYLDVYPYDRWSDKVIPRFETGQEFQPTVIEMNGGETSPPQLLSEADLIALMEKHGIGTDATHADHIETIKSRMYVGLRPDGRFLPGELGMGLVEGYDAMGYEMSKPNLRAELEADLKRISDGVKRPEEVLRQQIEKYKQVFIEAVRQAEKIDVALSEYFGEAQTFTPAEIQQEMSVPARKCPQCGQDMVLKTRKEGKGFYLTCMGYPNCRNAIWFPNSVIDAKVDEATCTKCAGAPRMIQFKFKRGSVPPYIPLEYVGCVGGCDNDLCEILSLRMQPPSQTHSSQSRSNDSGIGRSLTGSVGRGSQNAGRGSQGRGRGSQGGGRGSQGSGRDSQDSGLGSPRSFSTQGSQRAPLTALASSRNTPGLLPGGAGRSRSGGVVGPSGESGDHSIVCSCGENARQLTVRKEGPNTGRQFYVCPKPQESKCNFFLWADEGAAANSGIDSGNSGRGSDTGSQGWGRTSSQQGGRGGGGQPASRSYSSNSRNSMDSAQDGESVLCQCGQPAKQLTVQKQGPNTGRQFFACPQPRGEGCNFFQWQDEMSLPGSGTTSQSSFQNPRGGGGGRGGGGLPASQSYYSNAGSSMDSDHENVLCQCGQPAKQLTVQKQGPNTGRQFFACPQPRGEGCNFFQWQDEMNTQGSGTTGQGSFQNRGGATRGRGGGTKRMAPSSAAREPGAKRKVTCSNCGQQGHRKNKCPL